MGYIVLKASQKLAIYNEEKKKKQDGKQKSKHQLAVTGSEWPGVPTNLTF